MSDTQQPMRALSRGGLAPGVGLGAVLMALNLGAAIAVFWLGLEALAVAWQTPEYSHGPIIPLLSLFMFLREMKAVPPVSEPVRDRWIGVLVVLVALLIGVVGTAIQIPIVVAYGLILWVGGTVLTCFGARRGWFFWPSVLHLVFMLPLPNSLYWPLSIWLQTVSSEIGVWFIRLVDIPVFLDGNIIDLGVFKLQVAEACSGLRYLFPVMSFSYVFGVLYTGPVWHKIVLLLSAAPITVLMNSFRIGMIGVMVENFGIGHAEGFLHYFEGWVIFIGCVMILFGLAALMQRLTRDPRPIGESIDMDFDGIPAQAARFFRIPASAPIVVAAALGIGAAVTWPMVPKVGDAPIDRLPLAAFPLEVDGWQGRTHRLDPVTERTLGAHDYLSVDYRHADHGAPVEFFVAFYEHQTGNYGIHSPQVCLPAGGWEVWNWEQGTIALDPAVPGSSEIKMNRAIIQKGVAQQLVIYWVEQQGERLANEFEAKLHMAHDALTKGRDDGALVRLTTPLAEGETAADAEARIMALIGPVMAHLPQYVPE